MATVFFSELLRELFTKKTCIYLPHTHETFNENCVVWETKYFFRKEVYSSRGKLSLESTCTNENVDGKEEVNEKKDLKQSPVIEKLRPVLKQKENEDMREYRMKAIMKSKMSRKSSARTDKIETGISFDKNKTFGSSTTGKDINKMNVSGKSKILGGSATQDKFTKLNSNNNNTKRTGSQANVGRFSNVDHRNVAGGRNISQLNAVNSSNKHLKTSITDAQTASRKQAVGGGGGNGEGGGGAGGGGVNSNQNRNMANRNGMAEGQLSQSQKLNAVNANRNSGMNAVGDAVRLDNSPSQGQNNNLNQISSGSRSGATSKMTRVTDLQQQLNETQNKNNGAGLISSTDSKSLHHLSANAYDYDQTQSAYAMRNEHGVYVPSRYGVRSSFPSKCDKTNLVFDERQKTLDFSSQCTEKSIFQDDDTLPGLDSKIINRSAQGEKGMFILKITTGRQN